MYHLLINEQKTDYHQQARQPQNLTTRRKAEIQEVFMMQRLLMTRRNMLFSLVGIVMTTMLTLWGCGTSSYTDPNDSITTTKTATALIEPATLKQWMDEGKVNTTDPASLDRVVIVTVSPSTNYTTAHIPGAQLLNSSSELSMSRLEGVGTMTTMMLNGTSMDGLIQKLCIDEYTTIVFTVSKGQNFLYAARAYFTFRYWGFPKERLKVLNGGDNAWEDAATASAWPSTYALTAAAPAVAPSTFSVKKLYSASTSNLNFRYSIGEMLALVDKINTGATKTDATGVSILDVRGGSPSVYINNAIVDDYAQYATIPAAGKTAVFKSPADITAHLNSFGVTSSKSMNYVYCVSGYRASVPFFALDGMLSWPVTMYDGSWGQWTSYASTATANKVAAAWQTDVVTAATTANRTFGAITTAGTSMVLDPISSALYSSITDSRANQLLNEDKAYFTSGSTSTAPVSTGGGSGSASGC
jgi:3-mercaptopyruvate sulfurtransferase SseA